jgi:hypothetical protein
MTTTKRHRLVDLLWWLQREDVMKEIATSLGEDSINTKSPEWFTLRTKASKNMVDRMTDAEKAELRKKGEEMARKGKPKEIQRK